VTLPDAPLAETVMAERRRPRVPRANSAKKTARHFADPFAAGDDGANCMRCGYLVEPVREKRGLLTCAACG
jgi:hypothetical protein